MWSYGKLANVRVSGHIQWLSAQIQHKCMLNQTKFNCLASQNYIKTDDWVQKMF